MTPEQSAAYVFSQAACMLVELELMKAANAERERKGFAQAYDEEAFAALIDRYGVHHNGAMNAFNEVGR